MTTLILAILIGGAFGFVLDRIGATNPDFIIGMLRLSRLHLMKTILLAIGFSSLLMFGGLLAGLVEPGHLSVKSVYTGVFIGGALLGLGFAIAGYCPGTGLAAAAGGRVDAMVFMIGGLVGAGAYMASYDGVKSTGILGGKAMTLGSIDGTFYAPMFAGISGEWVGMALGLLFILVAILLPDRLRGAPRSTPTRSANA